jgi:hypothetical protein
MISQIPGKGARYVVGFVDSDNNPLTGDNSYKIKQQPAPAGRPQIGLPQIGPLPPRDLFGRFENARVFAGFARRHVRKPPRYQSKISISSMYTFSWI